MIEIKSQIYYPESEEVVTGFNNSIYTDYPLTVEGDYNRIEVTSTGAQEVIVSGNKNTIYGNGDVTVQGKMNVVSSTKGSQITFIKNDSEYVITIDDEKYLSRVPYTLYGEKVVEVYRYHKVPFLVKEKSQTDLGIEYLLEAPTDHRTHYLIEDKDKRVWRNTDLDYLREAVKLGYKYDSYGDELRRLIGQKVVKTKLISLYEYWYSSRACIKGVKSYLDEVIPSKRLPSYLLEGQEMPLDDFVKVIKSDQGRLENDYNDKSVNNFLQLIWSFGYDEELVDE